MRYHYEKPSIYSSRYGETYICDHIVYSSCTLFKIGNKGLSIIQQRYNRRDKTTWWGEIDPWLTDDLYLNPGFKKYFDGKSGTCTDGIYPTVTIRQIMWALKMKPLVKQKWETCFDRNAI